MRRPISAIIISYNDRIWMRHCLDALAQQLTVNKDEIIVVDNASTDGVVQDLRADSRVRLIENAENAGFPVGCNMGYAAAALGNDIFLLNNDAVLAEGTLEHLQEALYSADDIGAVGAVSNNALEQIERGAPTAPAMAPGTALTEAEKASATETYMRAALAFGAEHNRRYRGHTEARSRLTGFAVLIRRVVADRLILQDGFLMDPRFSPGYFEDEDLGVRIALAGFRQLLCHDAFIWHKGGDGFASHPEALQHGRELFAAKWGFDIWSQIGILEDYEEAVRALLEDRGIPADEQDSASLRILEIDCGMGVNLAHLQYLYPQCEVLGIEADPVLARVASQLIDVIGEDVDRAMEQAGLRSEADTVTVEQVDTPEAAVLRPASFDLIFAWDCFDRNGNPQLLQRQLQKLLKKDGRMY